MWFRENNADADSLAGRHGFTVRFAEHLIPRQPSRWKVQFDGSFSANLSCIGFAIWVSLHEAARFERVLEANVPVEASSAVPAQLLAAIVSIGVVDTGFITSSLAPFPHFLPSFSCTDPISDLISDCIGGSCSEK